MRLKAEWEPQPPSWRLCGSHTGMGPCFIPWPKHGLFMGIYEQIPWQVPKIDARPLLAVLTTNTCASVCTDHFRQQINTVPANTHTYWSIWVMREVYYVLPTLHLSHLCQIIQAYSINIRLNWPGNVHSALCLISDTDIQKGGKQNVMWCEFMPETAECGWELPNPPWEIHTIRHGCFTT